MALKDWLNLVSSVSVIRTITTTDGMGGASATSSTITIPLCALWQNGSNTTFRSDRYLAKDSSHTLVYEYGAYNFGVADASGGTVIETISYGSETYKLMGFQNNYLELNEIVTQGLERMS